MRPRWRCGRLDRGSPRQGPLPNQFRCELGCRLVESKSWNSAERTQPFGACGPIATSRLIGHSLRDEQAIVASTPPPAPRECLMSREDDIATGASAQITDDARLDVDASNREIHTSDAICGLSNLLLPFVRPTCALSRGAAAAVPPSAPTADDRAITRARRNSPLNTVSGV